MCASGATGIDVSRFSTHQHIADVKTLTEVFQLAGIQPTLTDYHLSLIRLRLADAGLVVSLGDLKAMTVSQLVRSALANSTFDLSEIDADYLSPFIGGEEGRAIAESVETGSSMSPEAIQSPLREDGPGNLTAEIEALRLRFPEAVISVIENPVSEIVEELNDSYGVATTDEVIEKTEQELQSVRNNDDLQSAIYHSDQWSTLLHLVCSNVAESVHGESGALYGTTVYANLNSCYQLCEMVDAGFDEELVEYMTDFDVPGVIRMSTQYDELSGCTHKLEGDFYLVPMRCSPDCTGVFWGFNIGDRDPEDIETMHSDIK